MHLTHNMTSRDIPLGSTHPLLLSTPPSHQHKIAQRDHRELSHNPFLNTLAYRTSLWLIMRQCPSVSHLTNRLRTLALTSPPETALFYARLWHAILPPTPEDHECLHVLSLCYLQSDQVYTALGYVRDTADSIAEHADHNLKLGTRSSQGCFACAMILGKCCDRLGRFSEGKDAVERALKRSTPTCESSDMSSLMGVHR